MLLVGLEKGPVVAEHEATAAVTAAQEAARKQQELALLQCNAEWTARLGELSCSHVPLLIWAASWARHSCTGAERCGLFISCQVTVISQS